MWEHGRIGVLETTPLASPVANSWGSAVHLKSVGFKRGSQTQGLACCTPEAGTGSNSAQTHTRIELNPWVEWLRMFLKYIISQRCHPPSSNQCIWNSSNKSLSMLWHLTDQVSLKLLLKFKVQISYDNSRGEKNIEKVNLYYQTQRFLKLYCSKC